MKKAIMCAALTAAFAPFPASAADTFAGLAKQWTFSHEGQTSEIAAFDSATNSLWVAGITGVDVLNAGNGSLIQHIDTTVFGSINSVAIYGGVAAFAIESSVDRSLPGVVKFFDTTTHSLSSGTNSITVGALPDMLTFTPDGKRLLVANEATPNVLSSTKKYDNYDPAGSVSIIDMNTRSVVATAGFTGVATTGSYLRTNTGMDFEPEYITVNADGTKAFVSIQEANGMGVLDLKTNTFSSVIGLGAKDFNVAGNNIDPSDEDPKDASVTQLRPVAAKGLYQPDGMAAYQAGGKTFIVMANEGDTREDDADKIRASKIDGTLTDLKRLNVSTTDSSPGNLFAFGARSFSIRDEAGNIVFDSGNQLDSKAIENNIYDDSRSDDKGVEPEGVELMKIGERTFAFIGLERTTKSAVAIYDVTDPANASFVDMLITDGDTAPEGLKGFTMGGMHYLAIANEGGAGTTTLYSLAPVPEPETYAMLLAGLGMLGLVARRRKTV